MTIRNDLRIADVRAIPPKESSNVYFGGHVRDHFAIHACYRDTA